MIHALLLALTTGAGPTLASPEFTTLNVSAEVATFCNEHLAQNFASRGVQVTTARQITAAIGLERQKQLLGCDEAASSCIAELASALGVDGMVLGELGKLGSKYQLNLRVTKSSTGAVLATWSRAVAREDDLLDALSDAAEALAPKILAAFGKAPAPAPSVTRHWPLAPTLIAAGLAVASGVSFGIAAATHGRLVDPSVTAGSIADAEGLRLKTQGDVTQWLALGTVIGAGVSLGVSIVWWALSGSDTPVATALAPWLSELRSARW